ncbi:MAG: TetR family transcriptional regulator, partial [Candidatus Aegiribacteria sp.]|nr:TetR family transcriptional regulator [Candidatus Aegiribacteria sp.]
MSQNTKRHLVETGVSIMRMNGFRSTGLSQVLKEAAVPKGSFYHYFDSKEEFGL